MFLLAKRFFWRPGVTVPNNNTFSRNEWLFGLAAFLRPQGPNNHAFLEHVWFLGGRRGRPNPQHRRLPAGPNTMYQKPKCRPSGQPLRLRLVPVPPQRRRLRRSVASARVRRCSGSPGRQHPACEGPYPARLSYLRGDSVFFGQGNSNLNLQFCFFAAFRPNLAA